jgi:imidazolonepropionase-like amidohydrolase
VNRSPIVATALAAALSSFVAASLHAQDLLPKAAPQSRPVVIQNAILHTIDQGTILGGSLWFEGGVIRGIASPGQELQLPSGADPIVIDGLQKHVWPGLIAAHSQLGLI